MTNKEFLEVATYPISIVNNKTSTLQYLTETGSTCSGGTPP